MYLLDGDGNIVDAEFSFDFFNSEFCIVVESSGGSNPNRGIKRRNPEYDKLLTLIFTRLKEYGIPISQIVLSSAKVAHLPVSEKVVELNIPYPIDLTFLEIDIFRKMVGRKVASMHRSPGALNKGNNQKRISICLAKPITIQQLMVQPELLVIDNPIYFLPHQSETERTYLRAARCGQGKFRDNLMLRYRAQCPVTGISNKDLLVASHIKPWNVCTNVERLDPDNGILLSVMIDRLFDRGLITFGIDGTIIVSTRLSNSDVRLCGFEKIGPITLSEKNMHYMNYHRVAVFRK